MFDEMYMAMAYSQVILGPVITAIVLVPILIYIVARWRSHKEDTSPDAQIGIKVAMCWFKVAAFQLLLMAGLLLSYATITDLPSNLGEQLIRVALGIALPSSIILGVMFVVLRTTNTEQRPAVHRMFAGVSLIQTGLVAFSALLYGGIALFQKNVPTEINRLIFCAVAVYGIAALMQGRSFLGLATGRGGLPLATASIGPADGEQ
ncbi:MAG: hypothetical protein JKY56_04655 [Kofleriaceae bacterium]|nr:hypothetical protein [Kofleriaceae bacterium]